MPIVRKSDAPVFRLPGLEVVGLASPRRGAAETCVWRLALEPGTPGVPHRVTREEIFVALRGSAVASVGQNEQTIAAGDTLVVPADTEFSLANRGDEPFEAMVAFPVGGKAVTGSDAPFTPPWAQ
ncbi:MAG TPA: cupin domain-containing protein [Polyangiaceae bacterium]|nr:cupin domain-containing protein [Polyangiaceae bacterium]